LRPLFAADWTAIPDWNAIGVATMRITTSTSETSMSGVMLGSWMPGSVGLREKGMASGGAAPGFGGSTRLLDLQPQRARQVLGLVSITAMRRTNWL
jgi:hypothetical protein